MVMQWSCKDCKSRYPGCHAECPTYKKEAAEWAAYKAKVKKAEAQEQAFIDAYYRRRNKAAKRYYYTFKDE